MKNRTLMGVSVALIFIALFLTTFSANTAMAYYGGYGGYGLGMLGLYGGYGGYGGYGLGMLGLYGGYGGYGLGMLGMYGGYGGYRGYPSLGLSSLYNPLSFYSYGSGLSNLLFNFDPLGDSLLGLGMFSFAF